MYVALISAGSAVLVGVLTLIGVVVSNNAHAAVMEEKITNLTKAVEEHNNFARKIPVIENDIDNLYHRYNELRDFKTKLP